MRRKILNLTQHEASAEQKEAGVVEPISEIKKRIKFFLTFSSLESVKDMELRAEMLARICNDLGFEYAMVGGAGYFTPSLVSALLWHGITPLFAFTKRESKEEKMEDGAIRKVSVFHHEGFVELDSQDLADSYIKVGVRTWKKKRK